MSLPLILAAKILKLKIYLLEPNFVLGRANRFFKILYKNLMLQEHIKNFPKKFKHKIETIYPLVRRTITKLKIIIIEINLIF